MEQNIVANKLESQSWMSGVPSLMKPLAVSNSLSEIPNTLQGKALNSTISKSNLNSSPPMTVASYSMYECLGCLVSTSAYTPLEIVGVVAKYVVAIMSKTPPYFGVAVLVGLVCYVVYTIAEGMLLEYQAFLELGKGGTPRTPSSWMTLMVKAFFAQVDVHKPPYFNPVAQPCTGRLTGLKPRPGKRPIVKGIAPQRQLDEIHCPEETFDRLLEMMQHMASKDRGRQVSNSYLEGRTEALMGVSPHRPHKCCDTDGEWNFEIAHPHKIDGSLHVVMHPQDICSVIENGWGERHPLATSSWLWKYFFHHILDQRRPAPYNLVLVYAPRDESEFAVIQQMLDAAVAYHKEQDACKRKTAGFQTQCDHS